MSRHSGRIPKRGCSFIKVPSRSCLLPPQDLSDRKNAARIKSQHLYLPSQKCDENLKDEYTPSLKSLKTYFPSSNHPQNMWTPAGHETFHPNHHRGTFLWRPARLKWTQWRYKPRKPWLIMESCFAIQTLTSKVQSMEIESLGNNISKNFQIYIKGGLEHLMIFYEFSAPLQLEPVCLRASWNIFRIQEGTVPF